MTIADLVAAAAITASAYAAEKAAKAGSPTAVRSHNIRTGGHVHRATHAAFAGAWYHLQGGTYHSDLVRELRPSALRALGEPTTGALGASWEEYDGPRPVGTMYRRMG